MTIGERIRESRKRVPMNQEDLGRLLGIGKSSVSDWESGKRSVPMDLIEKLAEVLRVSVPYIMGWEDHDQQQFSRLELSMQAYEIARKFDKLDEYSKTVISSIIDLELKRPSIQSNHYEDAFDEPFAAMPKIIEALEEAATHEAEAK